MLLECLAQDHMAFLSTLDPAIFLYIIKSIAEGLAAEGMTNLTSSDATGDLSIERYFRNFKNRLHMMMICVCVFCYFHFCSFPLLVWTTNQFHSIYMDLIKIYFSSGLLNQIWIHILILLIFFAFHSISINTIIDDHEPVIFLLSVDTTICTGCCSILDNIVSHIFKQLSIKGNFNWIEK